MSWILPLTAALVPVASSQIDADSIAAYHELPQIEVTAPLKQKGELFNQPVAGTTFLMGRLENSRIDDQKDFSLVSPNLYMPDYGSKMTGTIYIRGIGARMEQPSMGLYLDNVPILNKNNYEFDFYDIRKADVIRGPQGTLYGRNSIGGVMNIYTLSPNEFQGVRASAGYGNGNTADVKASVYRREGDNFAWSLAVGHHSSDGFFNNAYDGSRADRTLSEGVRNRLQWNVSDKLFIDNTLSFNYVDQKGFAYAFVDPATGKTAQVNHNDPCKYYRTGIVNGTTVRYDGPRYQFQSVTSYQFMDDKMTLDQDFLPASMFTLTQAQKEHAVTQEILLRSYDDKRRWDWLGGAFVFYKHNSMDAPVTFKQDGIEELILENANKYIGQFMPGNVLSIEEQQFVIASKFSLPAYGAALFHQSSVNVGRWRLTAGLRLELEHIRMTYDNASQFHYHIASAGPQANLLRSEMHGREKHTYFEVLPKFSAMYHVPFGNLYATVTRGYKAGGFNTQIFSDILKDKMQDDLIMDIMGLSLRQNDTNISYEPERNWNYEIGAHLLLLGDRLQIDAAAFYIDSRNQQITVFPPGQSTGRMMSNAGKSRSYGAELAAGYADRRLRLEASYGFTDARFIKYNDNRDDYKGNKVPYAPRNTFYSLAEYRFTPGRGFIDQISVRADWRGAGRMYWNENNSMSQGFYGLLGAGLSFRAGSYVLEVRGRNLAGKEYGTFYFTSIGNSFLQKGKPRQFGATFRVVI